MGAASSTDQGFPNILYKGGATKPLRNVRRRSLNRKFNPLVKVNQGPAYLPRPTVLDPEAIEAAQRLFDGHLNGNVLHGEVDDEAWRGAFAWLALAIQAVIMPGFEDIKFVVLTMLGRDQTYWYGRRREAPAEDGLMRIKAAAREATQLFEPQFRSVSNRIGLETVIMRYRDWSPTDGTVELHNCDYTVMLAQSTNQLDSSAGLVLLGHCLQSKFQQSVVMCAQRQSKRGGGYTVHHHEAPVKSYDRTEQKVLLEYGDNHVYTKPDKSNYVFDIMRSALEFTDAKGLESFLGAFLEEVGSGEDADFASVVRIKTSPDLLRHFLINVVYTPRTDDGKRVTYGDLYARPNDLAAKVRSFKQSGGFRLTAAQAMLTSESICDTEVTIIVEMQLYVSYFYGHRPLLHLWYKIDRATDLQQLSRDCELDSNRTGGNMGDEAPKAIAAPIADLRASAHLAQVVGPEPEGQECLELADPTGCNESFFGFVKDTLPAMD